MTSPRTGQTNRHCTLERWVSPTLTVRVTGPSDYQEDFTIAVKLDRPEAEQIAWALESARKHLEAIAVVLRRGKYALRVGRVKGEITRWIGRAEVRI